MKTAEEIILEIQELPPEERAKINAFLNPDEEEYHETCYPPEVLEEIGRDRKSVV